MKKWLLDDDGPFVTAVFWLMIGFSLWSPILYCLIELWIGEGWWLLSQGQRLLFYAGSTVLFTAGLAPLSSLWAEKMHKQGHFWRFATWR